MVGNVRRIEIDGRNPFSRTAAGFSWRKADSKGRGEVLQFLQISANRTLLKQVIENTEEIEFLHFCNFCRTSGEVRKIVPALREASAFDGLAVACVQSGVRMSLVAFH